jgi:hypothetical protein
MSGFTWLLVVLLVGGSFGGIISYCLEGDPRSPFDWPAFAKYLALGVGASFMVPLFLNTISSTLVRDALTSSFPDSSIKLLVISGFCLVAAISSKRFIASITDRLIREVEETRQIARCAEDKAKDAEETVNILVEPEEVSSPTQGSRDSMVNRTTINTVSKEELGEEQKTVLKTMINSTYATRAESGIKNDTGIQSDILKKVLSGLREAGYLEKTETRKGFDKWTLTRPGKEVAKEI